MLDQLYRRYETGEAAVLPTGLVICLVVVLILLYACSRAATRSSVIAVQVFGIRPSRMNPKTCTVCELIFTRVMKARQITVDVSVLFADLRGYTAVTQAHSAEALSSLLDAFYDEVPRPSGCTTDCLTRRVATR